MYAFVTSAAAGGTASAAVTAGVDTTGANLIILGVSFDTTNPRTISDSKSNVWTPLTATTTADAGAQLYYSFAPTVGLLHTFSNTGSNNFSSIFMMAFSGAVTSPFDQQNGASNATALTLQPGSVTPTQDNELIISHLSFNGAGTPISINASFTQPTAAVNFLSANHYGAAMGYLIQTSAAAVNPTWTRTNADNNAARIATFKTPTVVNNPFSGTKFFQLTGVGT